VPVDTFDKGGWTDSPMLSHIAKCQLVEPEFLRKSIDNPERTKCQLVEPGFLRRALTTRRGRLPASRAGVFEWSMGNPAGKFAS
jgi:hypothetical protein